MFYVISYVSGFRSIPGKTTIVFVKLVKMSSAFSSKPEKEEVQEKMSCKCFKSEKRQKYLSIYLEIFKVKVVKMSNDLPSILQNNKGKKKYYPFQLIRSTELTVLKKSQL